MKEGQIISRLPVESEGKVMEIVIRTPRKGDLMSIWKFYNKVIKETEFLSRITPVSLKDEKKWLSDMLNRTKKKDTVYIVAEHEGKIVDSCSIERKAEESHKHVGVYGICILRKYTGMGLGTKLTERILKLAKKELNIEIVRLDVFSKNKIARKMYRNFGFVYAGKIPNGSKRKGKYQDDIIMYKALK